MKMDNNKKGFIVVIVVFLVTILLYITRFGGEKYIFLTDLLAVLYSFVAIIIGLYAIRMYSFKSLQGKALFLIVLGLIIWFLAELIWLIFFRSAYVYVESLRFLGYVPLIAAFFSISSISDPILRKQRKKLLYLFVIFLIFAIIYLNVIPVIFGGTSLLENILNNGYVVVDFILLFGIFLLLKTSIEFKKGSLSFGWLIIALAFIALFIFDVYFAFYFDSYYFGDLIEIFWLSPYILLSYGFFYQYQALKDFLKSTFGNEETKKDMVKKPVKKDRTMFIMVIIAIIISLLLLYLLLSFVIMPLISKSNKQDDIIDTDFIIEYRDDVSVVFTKEVLDILDSEYSKSSKEYLFCLIGNKTNNDIYVNNLTRPKLFYQGLDIVISKEDPACQIENSLGSIHSHLETCKPSFDDFFSWGEMKNPEPIINAIRCDNIFYILLMPEEHEALDFRSLKWKTAD